MEPVKGTSYGIEVNQGTIDEVIVVDIIDDNLVVVGYPCGETVGMSEDCFRRLCKSKLHGD